MGRLSTRALLRFARELSSRMGAVVVALALELDQVVRMIALDRGVIVDEYRSVPEFYGPLPPGDHQAQADREHRGLHDRLEQALLGGVEGLLQVVHFLEASCRAIQVA